MNIKLALIENNFIATISLHPIGLPYPSGNWIPLDEAIAAGYEEKPKFESVPDEIPLWAFRASIELNGLTSGVVNMIKDLPEPDETIAWQQWEYANWISRNHPAIDSIAEKLNLNKDQVDNLFKLGAKLI